VGTPFPLPQKCLWERRSHSKHLWERRSHAFPLYYTAAVTTIYLFVNRITHKDQLLLTNPARRAAALRTCSFASKVAFNLPHLHLAPPLGVAVFEFCRDFQHQKTRIPGLSCSVVCVILRLAVSVEYQLVTDGRMDRQTHDDN